MRAPLSLAAVSVVGALMFSGDALANPCAVNPQARIITCTGRAAPNPTVTTLAAARAGAEKAARADAQRSLLDAFMAVDVGGRTAGDVLKDVPEVSTPLREAVSRFKITDTRYYQDGGVDIDVEIPLDDLLKAVTKKDADTK